VGHSDFIKRVVSVNGTTAVTASSDSTLRVWDLREAKATTVLKGHIRGVEALAVAPAAAATTGHLGLVSGASEGQLKAWDVGPGGDNYTSRLLGAHLTTVHDLIVVDGVNVWSASADKTVQLRDLRVRPPGRLRKENCARVLTSHVLWGRGDHRPVDGRRFDHAGPPGLGQDRDDAADGPPRHWLQ